MKTVITFGTFDLFHIGHLRILERAAKYGDKLIVGISTDKLNFSKKGFNPVFPQEDRRDIIASLSFVDKTFFEESLEMKGEYIKEHKADILVMGSDWAGKFDEYKSICEVVYLPRTTGISTTQVKQKVIEMEKFHFSEL
ncbi:MAG: adenylyltransferase/cytidyltransferase family protein [Alphaproteobacteria bacterium]|nr:adenylyltransferase/cytidyltransferase family protein [Alphaproteobacteria bacterium]